MDIEDAIVEAVRSGKVRVPPYPAAALKLAKVLAKPDFEQTEVVDVVKTDSMLTAAVLRLANSANYQRGQPVSDVTRAVSRIGSRQVHTLAMASGVQGAIDQPGALSALRRRAWLEGLCSARVCEVLARERGDAAETAFVAGLLHDLGKLLAIATIEDILKAHPSFDAKSADEWWSLVERFHLELGLVLSANWQLPDDLISAVTEHHEPEPTDPALQRLMIGDQVVRLLDAQAALSADDLGSIASLSTSERQAIAAALEALPAFIASFELDMSNEAPSKILPPPVPSAAQHGAPVVLHGVTHKPLEAEAVGFDDGKLVLLAKGDVRSNVLGKLDMSATESVHVRVVSCVADAGHFVVKVSPFALSVKQHAAWKAFGSSLEAQRAA